MNHQKLPTHVWFIVSALRSSRHPVQPGRRWQKELLWVSPEL